MATSVVPNDMMSLQTVNIPAENQTGLSNPTTGDIQVIRDKSRFALCRFSTNRPVKSSSSGWYTLFTFPDEIAPTYDLKFMLQDDHNGESIEARAWVSTKSLDVYAPRAGAVIWGSFYYIL